MRYVSVAEIANKWDVSERSVRNYCAQGRVNGAFLTDKTWNIPENAEKLERTNKRKEGPITFLDILKEQNDEIEISVYESDIQKQVFIYRQRMKNVVEPALEYEINIELLHGAKNVLCYKIDEENGNPMKVWKEMGAPVTPNEGEIEEIKNKSSLVGRSVDKDCKDGFLVLRGKLNVNDVHAFFIDI